MRIFGVASDIIPESFQAESIIKAFQAENIKGKRILLPRAAEARPVLPVELKKMGALVDEVPAYRTEAVAENADRLIDLLEQKAVDMITFTSSSTARNFKAIIPQNRVAGLLENVLIASIGPITTETAKNLGFTVHLTAETYTIEGLCDSIRRYY
ncbi:uroporphyrin-III C-methyltransferase, partial [sediment metagenome]